MKFKVGQIVIDDLTKEKVVIERINIDTNGNVGLWVSSTYLDGGRHPWEVTEYDYSGKPFTEEHLNAALQDIERKDGKP